MYNFDAQHLIYSRKGIFTFEIRKSILLNYVSLEILIEWIKKSFSLLNLLN